MSIRKKVVWGLGIFLVILSVAFTVLYFYAVNNAEKTLETLVENQSEGKLSLKITKVKIELSKLSFNFKQPILQTKDSLTTEAGYFIKAENISIKLSSIFRFIFKRKFAIDAVLIDHPEVTVTKYKASKGKKSSLTTEMGLFYKSIEDVLKVVEINYLHIDNATFMLMDKTQANNNTVIASNLFLTITKAKVSDGKKNNDRVLFTDNIQFDSYNQNLELNDGLNSLHYKHLSISSGNKFLKLDSCHFSIKNERTSKSKFDVLLDSINVLNVDYNTLLKDGLLKLDSAICYNPKINMQLELAEKKKKSNLLKDSLIEKEAVEHFFKKAFGGIDIGYMAVNNAKLDVVAIRNNQSSSYASEKINISFTKLTIIDEPAIPLRLDKFALAIKGYTAYTPDSLYTVKFDSVIVENQKISLTNFSLGPTKSNEPVEVKSLVAKSFELNEINWNELVFSQQLIADNITLVKPEVSLALPELKKNKTVKANSRSANSFNFLKDKIKINNFILKEGSVNVTIGKTTSASVTNCFAKVKVEKLLTDITTTNIVASIVDLSFSKGTYSTDNANFDVAGFSYSGLKGNLAIQNFSHSSADKSTQVVFDSIALREINLDEHNNIEIDYAYWASANIAIKTRPKTLTPTAPTKGKAEFQLMVNHLEGGRTNFNLQSAELKFAAKLNSISTDAILIKNDQKPLITNLQIDGRLFTFNQRKVNGTVASFIIKDKLASTLKNVKLNIETASEIVKLQLPELNFALDINNCLKGNIFADFITLNQPEISFEPAKTIATSIEVKNKLLPKFQVGRLEINNPHFINHPKKISDKMLIVLGSAHLKINAFSSNGEAISAKDLHIRLSNFSFSNEKVRLVPTGNEYAKIDASNFMFNTRTTSDNKKWHINLDTIITSGVILNITSIKQSQSSSEEIGIKKNEPENPIMPGNSNSLISEKEKGLKNQLRQFTDSLATANVILRKFNDDTLRQTIVINKFELENFKLNSENSTELKEIMANNNTFKIRNSTLDVRNSKSKIGFVNLNFDAKTSNLRLDNFAFEPAMNKDSFMLTKAVQTPYLKLNTGKLAATNFDLLSLINKKEISIQTVNVDSLYLYLYKDKTMPYNYAEKPMLTELLIKIPLRTYIDTVNLTRATIFYEELNDKTLLLANLSFNDLKGRITKVKNFDITETDSLKFKVTAQFMNATKLKVNYAQSYYDSLAAFNITVHISPFDLTALNPLIGPAVSAKINSGYLDTISMHAIGRRHVSWGVMKMYYHDLNLEYLDKGQAAHKTFLTRVVTFFADAVVKNKNTKGTGDVYAERIYHKGFPNYWLRILLSGVMTNTGLRTNNKQEKKYYQSIKKYKVPPIHEVTIE